MELGIILYCLIESFRGGREPCKSCFIWRGEQSLALLFCQTYRNNLWNNKEEVARSQRIEFTICKEDTSEHPYFWRRKMSRNRLMSVLTLLMIASMVLAACGGGNVATEAPVVTEAPTEVVATEAPTEAPVPTEPPTTRKGGWLDSIVVSVVASDSAVTQL